ncbi:MAG: NTP transferase domain-containing protein [Clostridia bacterium]|nr:NTP transferase domain-containing protein [Clostridia bacterium]
MLTKNQFDVLDCIISSEKKLSQRKIANEIRLSVGTVNKILVELSSQELVKDNQITEKGIEALEPYRVKRAVMIAAGFGSRLVPITLNTPKPLIRVNGKRIIESALDALVEVGIEEIYIVRGYLGKQFDELLYKYPTIKFIENEKYNEANNISSIVMAKDYLQNAYIIESDLFVYNKKLIKKYQYSSNYLGIPVEETHDWCFYTTSNNVIKQVSIGGKNCFQMVGLSYWTEEDGKQLAKDVVEVFNAPGGKERYWDQVPVEYCIDNYKVNIRPCKQEDIIEIDTFNELKAIDKAYDV